MNFEVTAWQGGFRGLDHENRVSEAVNQGFIERGFSSLTIWKPRLAGTVTAQLHKGFLGTKMLLWI